MKSVAKIVTAKKQSYACERASVRSSVETPCSDKDSVFVENVDSHAKVRVAARRVTICNRTTSYVHSVGL